MQNGTQAHRVNELETAAEREAKIRDLLLKVNVHCIAFYDQAPPEQRRFWELMDALDAALIAYRRYELPWDSQLIDVVESIGPVKVKAKAFSTFESVMDRARDLFAFVAGEKHD